MPRARKNQARHKELVANIQTFQDKIEELADISYINDEAFRVLSNSNMELYNLLKKMFDDIEKTRDLFTSSIVESRWSQQYLDPNFQRRTALKMKDKIDNPDYTKCSCGEWICNREDRFMEDHQKTKFHRGSLMRIDIQKKNSRFYNGEEFKNFEGKQIKPILNINRLDKLLDLNYEIARSIELKLKNQDKLKMSIYDWMECYIKRRKIRQLYNKYNIPLE